MSEKELLGDKVDKVLTKVGAKKVAKAYERVTKKPCGCAKRRRQLNDLHRRQIERAKRARSAKNKASPKSS